MKILYFCPTCKIQIEMPKVGCGCSATKRYFCKSCRKAYPEHRLEVKEVK